MRRCQDSIWQPMSDVNPIAMFFTIMIFVAGGIEQAIDGQRRTDQLSGGICVLFFSPCAIVPILELFRSNHRRK